MNTIIYFFASLISVIIFYLIDFQAHEKFNKKNNTLFHLIGLLIVLITLIALIISDFNFTGFIYLGIFLIFLGIYITIIATRELKDNFWNPRKIIKRGIYSKIRHPIYFSLILMLIGLAFFAGSIYILIYSIVTIFLTFILIKVEESFLIKKFKHYRVYKKKIGGIIPK